MDTTKKISFGFTKLQKKPNLVANKVDEKKSKDEIQMIKCLEENTIKVLNEEKPQGPLIIPVQENRITTSALASLKLRQAILTGEELDNEKATENNTSQQLSINLDKLHTTNENDLEKLAAKEILEELNKDNTSSNNDALSTVAVPIKPDELPLDGATESNLEDYEKIPISQFGLAMLRGMGWKDEDKQNPKFHSDEPMLRPKGMGLGADKVLKPKTLLCEPEKNEKLEIKKNAYVRILGGKHKDLYGQIEGLDDHAGRVIVKLAIGGLRESLNEFLVQPVSKAEYAKYGKVINSAKYEEYKRKEDSKGADENLKHSKKYYHERDERGSSASNSKHDKFKKESHSSRYENYEKSSDSRQERTRDQSHRRYSSSENSSEDNHRRKHKKKTKKSKRPRSRCRDRR